MQNSPCLSCINKPYCPWISDEHVNHSACLMSVFGPPPSNREVKDELEKAEDELELMAR